MGSSSQWRRISLFFGKHVEILALQDLISQTVTLELCIATLQQGVHMSYDQNSKFGLQLSIERWSYMERATPVSWSETPIWCPNLSMQLQVLKTVVATWSQILQRPFLSCLRHTMCMSNLCVPFGAHLLATPIWHQDKVSLCSKTLKGSLLSKVITFIWLCHEFGISCQNKSPSLTCPGY